MRFLHVSDFHFGQQSSFDRDEVQSSLLDFIHSQDTTFDGLVCTGDIAFSGRASEYVIAFDFFEKLTGALGIDGSDCVICPGNHDVDRSKLTGLQRTLNSTAESDEYFSQSSDCLHASIAQSEFLQFYNRLTGRTFSCTHAVGGRRSFTDGEASVDFSELNTAIFSRDDHDHGKLWVGRSSIPKVTESELASPIRVAVAHHPLDWLAEEEQIDIESRAENFFDFYLRGHLHRARFTTVQNVDGAMLHIAAGAAYQGARNPISANILKFDAAGGVEVSPIRYSEEGIPKWLPDNSKFGKEAETSKYFAPKTPKVVLASQSKSTHPDIKDAAQFDTESLFKKNGRPIFVEPRLCTKPFGQISFVDEVPEPLNVREILSANDRIHIRAELEYGMSTFAEYCDHIFCKEMSLNSKVIRAENIPNYKAKFQKYCSDEGLDSNSVVIIDSYEQGSHEKMMKVMIDELKPKKLVVLESASSYGTIKDLGKTAKVIEGVEPLFLWPLDRASIRELALQIFDPIDEADVNSAVDKTYSDLVPLAIPLTPTNVIMYLHILQSEGDFVPLDRVSIMDKYVNETLARASDQVSGGFGVRDRVSLVSSFVFDLYLQGKTTFTEGEWADYCGAYKSDRMVDFDHSQILKQLRLSRLVVQDRGAYHLRYAYLYDYFVGLKASSSPQALRNFLDEGRHKWLPKVVEVIGATVSDPEPLFEILQADLERNLTLFQERYLKKSFDPLDHASWKVSSDDEKFWEKISEGIDSGPASGSAIDEVKQSVLSETRSARQAVVIEEFSELEVEVFRAANALSDALRVAVGARGETKLEALRSILSSELLVLQIATVFSKRLALSRAFRWGGLLFVNESYDPELKSEDLPDVVGWVVSSIDINITEVVADRIGVKKLGPMFSAAIDRFEDITNFETLTLFALVLRTRPNGWEDVLRKIIQKLPPENWRQYSFVQVMLHDYKNDSLSHSDQESVKGLISFVEAKRSSNKDSPGKKSTSRMQRILEEKGRFD